MAMETMATESEIVAGYLSAGIEYEQIRFEDQQTVLNRLSVD